MYFLSTGMFTSVWVYNYNCGEAIVKSKCGIVIIKYRKPIRILGF